MTRGSPFARCWSTAPEVASYRRQGPHPPRPSGPNQGTCRGRVRRLIQPRQVGALVVARGSATAADLCGFRSGAERPRQRGTEIRYHTLHRQRRTIGRRIIAQPDLACPRLRPLTIREIVPARTASSRRTRWPSVGRATGLASFSQLACGWRISWSSRFWVRTSGSWVCVAVPTTSGRIIIGGSSSWDRMWQCQTEVPPMVYWPTQTVM